MNCQSCKEQQAEWSWQPFGPNEKPDSYTLLGSHYRGYPVIKVCTSCKSAFTTGDFPVSFTYKDVNYIGQNHEVVKKSLAELPDVRRLSISELEKQLEAFFTFVNTLGYDYLTDEGKVYFNHLKGEGIRRVEVAFADAVLHKVDGVDFPMVEPEDDEHTKYLRICIECKRKYNWSADDIAGKFEQSPFMPCGHRWGDLQEAK